MRVRQALYISFLPQVLIQSQWLAHGQLDSCERSRYVLPALTARTQRSEQCLNQSVRPALAPMRASQDAAPVEQITCPPPVGQVARP
jgi:hypothetical protein